MLVRQPALVAPVCIHAVDGVVPVARRDERDRVAVRRPGAAAAADEQEHRRRTTGKDPPGGRTS